MDIEYLAKKLEKDKNLILRGITIINSNINKNQKINRSVLSVSPLKTEKTLEDITKKVFVRDIQADEITERYELVLGNVNPYREYLDEFIDRITFFDLDENNELVSKIYLPFEDTDTKMFFKNEISTEDAREISLLKFKELVDNNNIGYISNELVQNLILSNTNTKRS